MITTPTHQHADCTKGIILIGPSGVGKSLIGTKLAKRLHIALVDIDQQIEITAGVDINWIFDREGESGFRKRELTTLGQAIALAERAIIATGAGIVVTPPCRKLIADSPYFVVYLHASAELLYGRVHQVTDRPMLSNGDKYQKVLTMLHERTPYYQHLCHYQIDCDNKTPHNIVSQILAHAPTFA